LVNKQAWYIKQAGKPGYYKNEVKRFNVVVIFHI
jgi:hypothetical protein